MPISNSEAKKIIKIQHIMHEYDQRACLAYAKEEGFAKGEARGVAIGREEGMAFWKVACLWRKRRKSWGCNR